jgi:hypothetical protein
MSDTFEFRGTNLISYGTLRYKVVIVRLEYSKNVES